MSNHETPAADGRTRPERTIVWVVASLALCILGLVAASTAADRWRLREDFRLRRAAMQRQMDEIRSGKIDCLVQPDPEFIDDLLADPPCAQNVECLYLGGDVSDPRLNRLHALPNADTIILVYAGDSGALLRSFQGHARLATLHLEKCDITPEVLDAIGKLPQLKTLCLSTYGIQTSDLAPLQGHPRIEHLVVRGLQPEPGLAPLLQSLPRLHDVKIELVEESKMPLDVVTAALKKALPKCQVEVEEYNGP